MAQKSATGDLCVAKLPQQQQTITLSLDLYFLIANKQNAQCGNGVTAGPQAPFAFFHAAYCRMAKTEYFNLCNNKTNIKSR